MSDVNHAGNLLSADQAVQKIRENILSNAQSHAWLDAFIQRNKVTIDALIENDTFGALSNFDAANPTPATIDQVKILQAFLLKKATLGNHDVNAITETLKGFIDNSTEQQRTMDNNLLNAQLRREESWRTSLPVRLDVQLYALNMIQILNRMEHLLQTVEQDSQDKKELSDWINKQRSEVANNPSNFKISKDFQLPYFLAGAGQISQFIRKEIQAILTLYTNTRDNILAISNKSPRSFLSPKFVVNLLLTGAMFAVQMGLTALLPYRLALTIFREINHRIQKAVEYVGKRFLPEQLRWMAMIPVFIVGYIASSYYAPYFSFQMLLGLQLFPQSWSWSFIGQMALGFSLTELSLGVGLGITKFVRRLFSGNATATAPQPNANLPVAPVELAIAQPVVNLPEANPEIALNQEQKAKLIILLMRDSGSIEADNNLSVDKKAKKKVKRGNETTALHGMQPYYLSKLDKKLLNKLTPLPEAFKNLEAEIRAVPRP